MQPIFAYLNYRHWLADLLDHYKEVEGYSLRRFSSLLELSHTYVTQVINAERDLADASVQKISRALALSQIEQKYLQAMVGFTQAKTTEEKHHFYRELAQHRQAQPPVSLDAEQRGLYSQWYNLVIREMVSWENFKDDPQWLNKKIIGDIPAEELARSLELLKELGLISEDKSGRLVQSESDITTGDETMWQEVITYHLKALELGKRAISEVDPHWRDVSSLTISVNRRQYYFIKTLLSDFRKRVLQYLADSSDSNFADDGVGLEKHVYQLNMQLFNQTELEWKKPPSKAVEK